MLVKLQRPPPEMRIFLPMRSACSRTATRRPRLPASMAQKRPAAPAPRMRTSKERDRGASPEFGQDAIRYESQCRPEEVGGEGLSWWFLHGDGVVGVTGDVPAGASAAVGKERVTARQILFGF